MTWSQKEILVIKWYYYTWYFLFRSCFLRRTYLKGSSICIYPVTYNLFKLLRSPIHSGNLLRLKLHHISSLTSFLKNLTLETDNFILTEPTLDLNIWFLCIEFEIRIVIESNPYQARSFNCFDFKSILLWFLKVQMTKNKSDKVQKKYRSPFQDLWTVSIIKLFYVAQHNEHE